MTDTPISVTLSSNEKGSGRDLALMKEIDRHPERWTFGWDDPHQGLDLLFRLGEREIRWELKECPDMLQSSQDGHLYMQRMQAASYGHPAQIAVLGPDMAVLEHVPKVTKTAGWLNPRERAAIEDAIERWDAACFASNFTPHYFSGGADNAMRRICKRSRAYLLGEIDIPAPKADSFQVYCFKGFPGVGSVKADDLISGGWRLELVEGEPVRGVGPKTIEKMREAVAAARAPGRLRRR